MATTAARLSGGAVLAGLVLTPLLVSLPHRDAPDAATLGNALVAFEPNAGRGPAGVDFYARLGGGTIAISPQQTRLTTRGGRTLTTKLVGARRAAPAPRQPLKLRVNSYLSRDPSEWRTGIRTYGGVRYGSVYPGIDLHYHGRGAQLEYDFIVKPGADPARIALDLSGSAPLRLDRHGNLIAGRAIRQLRPVAYQQAAGGIRHRIPARFVVDGNRVRFELGDYNRSRPLVIDPVLAFSDVLSSATGIGFNDTAYDVAVDSSGNAYVVGETWHNGSIPPGDPNRTGDNAGFVLKIAPDGSRTWITYIAKSLIADVVVASSGDPYVAGQGFDGMPTKNAADSSFGGGTSDAMVGRLNAADGTTNWLTYFGGTSFDVTDFRGVGIAVDKDGNAYVGGNTGSAGLFTGDGTFDTTISSDDGFVVEYTAAGARIKGTYFGGTGSDSINAIALDPGCQNTCPVFVTGQTNSGDLPVLNNGATTYGGNNDAFAAKLKGDLSNRDFATWYGGGNQDYGRAITVNSLGWPTIAGGRDLTFAPGGTEQAFMHQYDARTWTQSYDRVFGGSADDEVLDMATGSSNNFYLAGTTASSNFPIANALKSSPSGGDAFLMRINLNLTATDPVIWSTYFGGGNSEQGNGIAVGLFGDVWAAGETISNDFPRAKAAQAAPAVGGWVATIAMDPVSIDSGPSGTIRVHDASFTYSSPIPGASYGCRLTPAETSFSACVPPGKSYSGLADGNYTFEVRATDIGGTTNRPAARQFTIDTKPVAALTVAPNPALVGRPVTLDAGASTGAGQALARFEWDLDGDGSFERDTGATATTTETYGSPQDHPVGVRVTDAAGASATQTAQLKVNAAPPLGALFGVTINSGAQFTRTPNVTVTANFPATTTSMLFSNDGGFLAPTAFPPAKSVKWKLDSSGPERLPKQIYVRFLAGTIPSETFQDDIILDETPPTVQQAIVAPAGGAASEAASAAAAKRRWDVRVKAKDSNSGVARIQVTSNKKKPGKLLTYKRRLTVKSAQRPKWVRARDRAGNYSRWRKAR